MEKIAQFIQESKSVLILSHKNPDGDALGASLGLGLGLEKLGKQVSCFSVSELPAVFGFLPGRHLFVSAVDFISYDLVVLVDCAAFARTGIENVYGLLASFDRLLIIDHHPQGLPEDFETRAVWIDPSQCSSAVMVYELWQKLGVEIDKEIATCLLTGIFTDTGGFQHSNTDQRALEAAAELMKKGPRIDRLAKNIFQSKSLPAIKLWGKALERLKTDPATGMAVSYVSREDIEEAGAKQEDLAGLVSLINTVSDAKFSLLLTESDDHKLKGSLRSEEYNGVDVSQIAQQLGGGGHKLASGFELEGGDLKKNLSKITQLVLSLRERSGKDKGNKP